MSPRAWRALGVAAAGYVLFGFNSTATNLAFAAIGDSFPEASETTVSWVAAAFFIAAAAFLPLGGRLADRVGRRRVFELGLTVFAASAVVSAAAPTIWILIAARAMQAFASALIIPASLSMVLPEFPAARRPSAVATWAASGPLSAAVAPSAAAAMLQATSWRWLYLLSAPVALATLIGSRLFVVESRDDEAHGRLDGLGTLLASTSVGLLIYGIGQGPTWGLSSPSTIGVLAAAVLAGVAFVARSRRHPTPLLDLRLFRIPEVAIANVANFFTSVTSLSIWLIWPLFLTRIWDYPIGRVGLAITIGPLFAGPAALAGGRLADRYGQRWLMVFGTAVTTIAVLWSVVFLGPEPNYAFGLAPSVAMFGFGWGLSNPSMNSWALSGTPTNVYGEVNATFNTIRNLAAAIGTTVAIAIVGAADRVDPLAAYDRVNVFFATSVGLSFLTVTIGSWWVHHRETPDTGGDVPDPSRDRSF